MPNSDKKRINYISKKLSAKEFNSFDKNDLARLEQNLKGADKQTFERTERRIKTMSQEGFNQWKAKGFTTV